MNSELSIKELVELVRILNVSRIEAINSRTVSYDDTGFSGTIMSINQLIKAKADAEINSFNTMSAP